VATRQRVCVVGSGGREHALAAAISRTSEVVVCPGNAGMAALGMPCSEARPEEVEADLFVIGPEAPLVAGLADRLRALGRQVLGPGADGARLEGSKAWMKQLVTEAGVPTARYGVFDEVGPAIEFLQNFDGPWVVKTDGLAAGKGVLVTDDLDEASADVEAKLSGRAFGAAGAKVVIEEGLAGEELSVMALCDGSRAVPLAAARDYKRVGDKDTGPNTGGMGAVSPAPRASPQVVDAVMELSINPTLAALRDRSIDYRGVLYAGVMLTPQGPQLLEFNVRFGDPEAQVVLARWEGDVAATLAGAANGHLDEVSPPSFSSEAAVCVVLAAPGYPEAPRTGQRIEGLEAARRLPGVQLHCAGVGCDSSGELVTAGGRVVGVTALGPSVSKARNLAYQAAHLLSWEGMVYRSDIANIGEENNR
jgi:phosphoribosylamine--glycine ligase